MEILLIFYGIHYYSYIVSGNTSARYIRDDTDRDGISIERVQGKTSKQLKSKLESGA